MKNIFKYLGIAMLAFSLVAVACSKDDEENQAENTENNGGGSTGGGNTGGGNGGGNTGGGTTTSITFNWDGQNQEINEVTCEYLGSILLINGVKNTHQQGEQTLLDLPEFRLCIKSSGSSWQVDAGNPSFTAVYSTEIMADDEHQNMFTTYDGTNHIYTLDKGPDFSYVEGSFEAIDFTYADNKASGTLKADFKSVYDGERVKTLKVILKNYPFTEYRRAASAPMAVR